MFSSNSGEIQLSPVIRCNPKNFHFRKGVVLTFPHNALLKNHSWVLYILQKPEEINTTEWRKVLTLSQETPGTPIFAQVDPCKVYLVCEFLSDFVLVGRSFSELDARLFKSAMFLSKTVEDNFYNLKVQIFTDTPYSFYNCLENERKVGSTLICEPKTITFQENCNDLCFNIRELGVGWKLLGTNYQELPYSQIWRMNAKSMQCIFALQQTDSINCLELNLCVYQKQKQSNSINFNLKTNDLNSNFSCNKRFSCSSVEMGYSINIVENPFNYSSLSKKGGCYDLAYKNSAMYRSNFSTDNNYRTNVLSKSDRVILCKLLDTQTAKGNDWRLLAEKLKISSYYYYFSNTCSPTENILSLWLCRNNDVNMLVNLSRIFREMSRIDCATVVERRSAHNLHSTSGLQEFLLILLRKPFNKDEGAMGTPNFVTVVDGAWLQIRWVEKRVEEVNVGLHEPRTPEDSTGREYKFTAEDMSQRTLETAREAGDDRLIHGGPLYQGI
ncbi:hypothetical protein ACJJTC_004166 [Scirpophaga incertulas]